MHPGCVFCNVRLNFVKSLKRLFVVDVSVNTGYAANALIPSPTFSAAPTSTVKDSNALSVEGFVPAAALVVVVTGVGAVVGAGAVFAFCVTSACADSGAAISPGGSSSTTLSYGGGGGVAGWVPSPVDDDNVVPVTWSVCVRGKKKRLKGKTVGPQVSRRAVDVERRPRPGEKNQGTLAEPWIGGIGDISIHAGKHAR